MNAATQMVRIVEDLLASGQIQHCPIHIIPALFAAMSMLAIKIHSGDKVSQQLAYVKVKLCMIALRELQSSWPVSGWIFLLFAKIVRGIRDEDDSGPNPNVASRPITRGSNTDGYTASGQHNAQQPNRQVNTPISNNGSVAQWLPSPSVNGATSAYNIPQPSSLSNDLLPMPLDLSTDWSGVRDQDLWLVPGFDFLGDFSRANNFDEFPGT